MSVVIGSADGDPVDWASLDVENRRVLVLVDVDATGNDPAGDLRFAASLPTLETLRARGARIIVAGHAGRAPCGEKAHIAPSIVGIAERVAAHLDVEVRVPDEIVGDAFARLINDQRPTQLVMLENLDRVPDGSPELDGMVGRLVSTLDAFVHDALTAVFPARWGSAALSKGTQRCVAGMRMQRELDALDGVCACAGRGLTLLLGGDSMERASRALLHLVERMGRGDHILVGPQLHPAFVPSSPGGTSNPSRPLAARLRDKALARDVALVYPADVDVLDADGIVTTRAGPYAPDADERVTGLGARARAQFSALIQGGAGALWTGALVDPRGARASESDREIARAVADCRGGTVAILNPMLAAEIADLRVGIGNILPDDDALWHALAGEAMPGWMRVTTPTPP
ncbi:MAG: phosphoglycerate kinase [Nannocystaceae bacterium]